MLKQSVTVLADTSFDQDPPAESAAWLVLSFAKSE